MKRSLGSRTMGRAALIAATAAALSCPAGASAATINADITADVYAADGHCSLREAIKSANDDAVPFAGAGECSPGSGADTVALPAGTFTLARAGNDDTDLLGDLDVLGTTLTIAGAGAASTKIDAAQIDRVLDVQAGRIA